MAASLREARRFDPKSFSTEVETLASIVRGAAHASLEDFAGEAIAGLRALLEARTVTAFACTKRDARVVQIAEAGEASAVRPRNLDGSVRRAVLRREAFATRTKDGHSLWAAIDTPDRSLVLHVVRNERPFSPHEIQATEIVLALSASLATHERVAREAQEQARGVLDLLRSNPWPVLIYDAQSGRCIEANDAAVETYGFSRAEFLGRTLGTPPKPLQIFQPQRAITCRQRKKNGAELIVEQTACALTIEGRVVHVVVARDVTERAPAPLALRENAAPSAAGRLAFMGQWWIDIETDVCFWSEELFALARVRKPGPFPSSPGTTQDVLKRHVHPDDQAWLIAELKAVADTAVTRRFDYRTIRSDGSLLWVEMIATREDNADGRPVRLLGTIVDITERKETEARLEFLAKYDTLTGLANRSLLIERLGRLFEEADRNDRHVAVLLLDLDDFKRVNETLGHAAGDRFLQSIATRLRRLVGSEHVVARIGGDEFVLAVGDLQSEREAAAFAERIVAEIKLPLGIPEGTFFVEASIGIARYPRDARDPDVLITHADTAMYRAKRERPGTFRFYEAEMRAAAVARYRIESELRQALAGDELSVEYQPIVTIDGDVVGSEALVRWNHGSGRRSPGDFIGVAEDSGLIVPLGRIVLREACRQMAFWKNAAAPLGLSVNVSAAQLIAPDFLDTVRSALADSNFSPALLELEITETALNRDFDRATKVIRELRAMGVKIGIDDFGTGYNVLTSLRDYTFDTVKLDRSFVADIATSTSSRAIAEAVIGAARVFGARVVAEGVETETQRVTLANLGCEHAQGWLYSPALPGHLFNALAGAGIRLPVIRR